MLHDTNNIVGLPLADGTIGLSLSTDIPEDIGHKEQMGCFLCHTSKSSSIKRSIHSNVTSATIDPAVLSYSTPSTPTSGVLLVAELITCPVSFWLEK